MSRPHPANSTRSAGPILLQPHGDRNQIQHGLFDGCLHMGQAETNTESTKKLVNTSHQKKTNDKTRA